MDDKITIIEGPPPNFEDVHEGWPLGLNESPSLHKLALTRLRTFNGPSLVERCYHAWRDQHTIQLEFRANDGLIHKTPIVASRTMETDDGQLIFLWVRLTEQEALLELGADDDQYDKDDDDQEPPS
ncbi:MAG: hypothetical protein A2030_04585 [Chloroflexi bacterium RBG_19FT_COMBO_50_10]|nr:MAG: hypothetical protein A2030_04585 [Chloroflexi bacterium RBG_19FT_COMBO_50_10]